MITWSAVVASALCAACVQSIQNDTSAQKLKNLHATPERIVAVGSSITKDNTASMKWDVKKLSGREGLIAVNFLSSTHGWIVSHQGPLYKTTDGGETWQRVEVEMPPDSYVTSAHFDDSYLGWVAVVRNGPDYFDPQTDESWLMHTSDGGQSWQVQYSSKALQINQVLFVSAHEGWAVGTRRVKRDTLQNDPVVLHTTDQGRHWAETSDELNRMSVGGNVTSISTGNSARTTLITNAREVFSTNSGEQDWKRVAVIQEEPSQTAMRRIVDSGNESLWVLGGTDGREGMWTMLAQMSSYSGAWTKYRVNGVSLQDVVFLSDGKVLACGSLPTDGELKGTPGRQGVILRSADAGRNWTIVYRNAEVKSINSLAAVDPTHVWAVGDNGLVIRLLP